MGTIFQAFVFAVIFCKNVVLRITLKIQIDENVLLSFASEIALLSPFSTNINNIFI
jgi:hypothetical protein